MHVALAVSSLSFTLPEVKSSWASGLLIMKWSAGQGVGRVEVGEAVSTDTFRYFLNFPTTAAETSLSRALFLLFSVFLLLIIIKNLHPPSPPLTKPALRFSSAWPNFTQFCSRLEALTSLFFFFFEHRKTSFVNSFSAHLNYVFTQTLPSFTAQNYLSQGPGGHHFEKWWSRNIVPLPTSPCGRVGAWLQSVPISKHRWLNHCDQPPL